MKITLSVIKCGDDLQLIMTYPHGVDNETIHKLAWDTFMADKTSSGAWNIPPYKIFADLPLEEMEYTTMPQVMEKLAGRFVDLD